MARLCAVLILSRIIDGVAYAIDVVVAEPAGTRHMDHRELSSVTTPAGAARQAEAQKIMNYRGTLYEAV